MYGDIKHISGCLGNGRERDRWEGKKRGDQKRTREIFWIMDVILTGDGCTDTVHMSKLTEMYSLNMGS